MNAIYERVERKEKKKQALGWLFNFFMLDSRQLSTDFWRGKNLGIPEMPCFFTNVHTFVGYPHTFRNIMKTFVFVRSYAPMDSI